MKYIDQDLVYLGKNNNDEQIFEGYIPLRHGMSYNSYLLIDNKTCLFDTVDASVSSGFIDSVKQALKGRNLDAFVIHHLEPDHTAMIEEVISNYPNVTVYLTSLALIMFKKYFPNLTIHSFIVKDNDVLDLGEHKIVFFSAPMVHWPEVCVSYDELTKTLFSADAFGSFTTVDELDSSLFHDKKILEVEERRYYVNIVSKYGFQVNNLIKKVGNLEIRRILSLHGPIHTKRIPELIEKYLLWANYKEEKTGVLVVYTSVYGHTEVAAKAIAHRLNALGVDTKLDSLMEIDETDALADCFIYPRIVLCTTTFNTGIYIKMKRLIEMMIEHGVSNKTFSLVENGSWAPQAGNLMKEMLEKLKNSSVNKTILTINASFKEENIANLETLVSEIKN